MGSNPDSKWYEKFFTGAALDLWRSAKSIEETEDELAFLQEMLDAPEGSRLLDVPCGNGRLSIPLAIAGFKVTGLDFSTDFVNEATTSSSKAGVAKENVRFVQGDMRTMVFEDQFDGAFCLGNSFGYFDREGTIQSLTAIAKTLKAGTKFVLDSSMLAESFLVNGGEREWIKVGDMLMLIENQYDCRKAAVKTNYTFIRAGKEEHRQATHWIYTAGEVCDMFKRSGFKVIDLFSSTECEPFELGSERLLLLAEKQ